MREMETDRPWRPVEGISCMRRQRFRKSRRALNSAFIRAGFTRRPGSIATGQRRDAPHSTGDRPWLPWYRPIWISPIGENLISI
jgi:hypothetical protein